MRNWKTAPIVHVDPPACPSCHVAAPPVRVRTTNGGDGPLAWQSICPACSKPFVLVFDPPEIAGFPYWGNQRPSTA